MSITKQQDTTQPSAASTPFKKTIDLTRKQAAFVNELIRNPKQSATAAVKKVYNTTTDNSASQIATDNLRNPQIMKYLNRYDAKAQKALGEALNASKKIYRLNHETKGWEYVGDEDDHGVRIKAADSILDRIYGKATQRIESETVGITFTLDLTGKE